MNEPATRSLLATWPLLLGMGVLMLGAGLQGTLIGLRATLEGFPTFLIGVIMSGYYIGYVGGSLCTAPLVQRVGHIRVFAALTAIASVAILLQAIFVGTTVWTVLRMASGFCFAGIYVVAESWLNDRATNRNRGTLLAVYMVILYVGLGCGQFLLNAADPSGPLLFVLTSVLISLAVVPMTLSVQDTPEFGTVQKIGPIELYRISPMGVVGVIAAGMLSSALFSLGPVYAGLIGLGPADVAIFMAISILPAVLTQLPIGRLSDRVDRRSVLGTVCTLAACIAAGAAIFGASSKWVLFILAGGYGGIVLTLYSLSLSNIHDHMEPRQMVSASASAILMNGTGAVAGPLVVAGLMGTFGSSAFFGSMAALLAALSLYAFWRRQRRAPVVGEHKVPFVGAQPQAIAGQMVAEAAQAAAEADLDHRSPHTPSE